MRPCVRGCRGGGPASPPYTARSIAGVFMGGPALATAAPAGVAAAGVGTRVDAGGATDSVTVAVRCCSPLLPTAVGAAAGGEGRMVLRALGARPPSLSVFGCGGDGSVIRDGDTDSDDTEESPRCAALRAGCGGIRRSAVGMSASSGLLLDATSMAGGHTDGRGGVLTATEATVAAADTPSARAALCILPASLVSLSSGLCAATSEGVGLPTARLLLLPPLAALPKCTRGRCRRCFCTALEVTATAAGVAVSACPPLPRPSAVA